MKEMKKIVTDFLKEEEGVTALEYALIAALIAVAIIAALSFLGGEIGTTFNDVGNHIKNAG